MEDTETVRLSNLHPDEYQLVRNGNSKRRPDPTRKISFKQPPQQEIIPDFVNPDTSVSVATSMSSVSVKKRFYKFNLPNVTPQDISNDVMLPLLVPSRQDEKDPGS